MRYRIFPILTGMVAFMMLTMIGEKLLHLVYEPPTNMGYKFYSEYIGSLGTDAFVLLGFIWAVVAALSGVLVGRLSGEYLFQNSVITGVLATLVTTLNLIFIPFHPTWFNIVAPLLPFPALFFAARAVGRRKG